MVRKFSQGHSMDHLDTMSRSERGKWFEAASLELVMFLVTDTHIIKLCLGMTHVD